MECEYFGVCGSCNNYEGGYEAQLERKLLTVKDDFSKLYSGEFFVAKSEDSNYRSRSEFKVWHIGDKIYYAMNSKIKGEIITIDSCSMVSKHINHFMPLILDEVKKENIDFKLFGADFLSSGDDIVISLLYHKQLDSEWKIKAQNIATKLNINIIGRARKQKIVCGNDFVVQKLFIDNKEYSFKYIENSFTQPNSYVNEQMITWAMDAFKDKKGDLLELYCGAGNFTIPFANIFNKVLATEISKSSINAAKTNMELNGVSNIEFVRMSVEDFVGAIDGVRVYRRMSEIDISSYSLESIFVDPPRSGIDEESLKFVSRFDNIVYISCNPETLKRDLEILKDTHEIESMAVFDQFAYTKHLEMGASLKRKK